MPVCRSLKAGSEKHKFNTFKVNLKYVNFMETKTPSFEITTKLVNTSFDFFFIFWCMKVLKSGNELYHFVDL